MPSADATRPSARLAAPFFFGATWLLLAVTGRSRMFRDPGTFWHLLTGERILRRGLPHEDWLTFTFQGKPWIAHQWLSECAMALLQRLGGYDALLVAATGGLALLFTWLFQRLVAATVQVRWAVLLTALAITASAGSLHLRPLVVSMAFFAWMYARLVDVETGRTRLRALAWLLPVLILWVNCHGAVLGGIATFGLVGAWWLVAWALRRSSPVRDRSEAVTLVLLVLGAVLTPFVNPYGLEMVRTWLAIIRSPVVAESIVEHGSVWRTGSWFVLPFAGFYLAMFLGAGDTRWRATSVLPLVWLALMLQRVRHAPLFAIAGLLALAELVPRSGLVAWLARRGVEVCGGASTGARVQRLIWLAPIALLGLTAVRLRISGEALGGPEHAAWPYPLKPQIAAAVREAGPAAPILNDMALGGFLSYELPGARIFGDDRCELYGDHFLRAWLRGDASWYAGWVARFDIRLAVAERGTPLERYLRAAPGWREVAATRSAEFFVRDGPR